MADDIVLHHPDILELIPASTAVFADRSRRKYHRQ